MVSNGYEVYWDDHLVSYIMSNHWGIYLKLSEQPLNRGHRKRLPIVKVKYKMETGLENFLSSKGLPSK